MKPEMMGFLTSAGRGDIVFFGTIHPQTLFVGFWKTASFFGFRFRRQRAPRQSLPGGALEPGSAWLSSSRQQACGLPRKVLVAVV